MRLNRCAFLIAWTALTLTVRADRAPTDQSIAPLTVLTPLSATEFDEALAALDSHLDPIRAVARTTADQKTLAPQIVAAFAGLPHVADTGVAPDGSVWARLVDGTPIAIPLDRPPVDPNRVNPLTGSSDLGPAEVPAPNGPLAATAGRGGASVARLLGDTGSTSFAFPETDRAWLVQYGTLAPFAAASIDKMLSAQQYSLIRDNSTGAFRDRVRGIGVAWVSTHSAEAPDSTGRLHYGLVTGEEILGGKTCTDLPDECQKTRDDVAANRAGAGFLLDIKKPFIMVNENWVRTYWRFANNSLVFIDACDLFNAEPLPQAFLNALVSQPVGASVVVGWQGLVWGDFSERTATWFFSRVLGATDYLPTTPPQRPFSVQEVYDWMSAHGRIADPGSPGRVGTAVLKMTQATNARIILAPSIRNMVLKESSRELHLIGEFGDISGTVEISGASRQFSGSGWTSREIVVSIPDNGTGSSGDVVVKYRGHQTSNAVPLTDWQGTARLRHIFSGSFGPPGGWYELKCDLVHFRADVHRFRLEPEETAQGGSVSDAGTRAPTVPIDNLTADSQCAATASNYGEKTAGPQATRFVFNLERRVLTWTDNANKPPTNWFFGLVNIDTSVRALNLGLNSTADGAKSVTTIVFRNGQQISSVLLPTWSFSSAAANDVIMKKPLSLDGGFNVAPATDSLVVPFGVTDTGEYERQYKATPATIPTSMTKG